MSKCRKEHEWKFIAEYVDATETTIRKESKRGRGFDEIEPATVTTVKDVTSSRLYECELCGESKTIEIKGKRTS